MVEKSAVKRIEVTLENLLFSARWLLAPFYFGLAISLFGSRRLYVERVRRDFGPADAR